ncbi:unnamed protein product [Fusarium venenatum]|uniref:Major facilitator superfamily (MFS) profile domain-containing protein n=1 Tax=Fusarium venenatum TaxID=56646 RepID=A0A2L2SS85_9HYPO|nr:uncharacterized protein FVRRES_04368 [Fusarium venenatum]CEI59932.1 unnamed protein product [Fusarium venenatum]
MPELATHDNGRHWPLPLKRIGRWLTTVTHYMNHQRTPIYPLNVWLCVLVLSIVKFASTILLAYPWPKLLAAAVCRYHYENKFSNPHMDPPNSVCASGEVTMHFEYMMDLLNISSSLASIVVQIPMGILVDRGNRRLAFTLNIISIVLYWGSILISGLVPVFPLWCFYLSPVLLLLGGGPFVTGTLVCSTISNSVKPRHRTTVFSLAEALSVIWNCFEPTLMTSTMTIPLWLSFMITIVMHALLFIPAYYLTEDDNASLEDDLLLEVSVFRDEVEPLLDASDILGREVIDSNQYIKGGLTSKLTILTVCFVCFFLVNFATGSMGFMFSWIFWRIPEIWSEISGKSITMSQCLLTIHQIKLLSYLRAIVASPLFFIVLPLALRRLDRTMHFAKRDLVLSTAGIACAAVGTLLASFASNIVVILIAFVITLLGSVMSVALRSFLTSNVENQFSGRLFAGISMTETIGSLVGAPIMHNAYTPDGLPFAVSMYVDY